MGNTWRTLAAALLLVAAIAALVRSLDGNFMARVASVMACATIGLVALGVYRERSWALGAGFFIALFWFWATLALRVQGVIGAPEFVGWITWAIVVIVSTVRARPS
jgi:hypothetical protein